MEKAADFVTEDLPRETWFREFLIVAAEKIESLPLIRPRWMAMDVALLLMFVFF